MSQVTTRTVADGESDLRLDRWFKRHYPWVGHAKLEKLLRTGQIRVDGGRAKAATRLEPGQTIRIPPLGEPPRDDAAPRPVRIKADPSRIAELQAAVLHKDDAVLVINKPAGLATQGGTGQNEHLDGLLDHLRFGAAGAYRREGSSGWSPGHAPPRRCGAAAAGTPPGQGYRARQLARPPPRRPRQAGACPAPPPCAEALLGLAGRCACPASGQERP